MKATPAPYSSGSRTVLGPLLAALCGMLMGVQPAPAGAQGKQVPPPGIQISEADRKELQASVSALQAEISAIAQDAKVPTRLRALLPDVEIFHKAVDWALRY